jgi:RNA polymerase sigma-70 factor, ECF subfamily
MKVAINFHAVGSACKREAPCSGAETKGRMFVSKRSSAREPAPGPGKSKPTSYDDPSLLETIRLAKQGDSAAFETIYRRYSGRVYALSLRILRDPVEAEDALQDAFMLLFRKIHTFRGESAFSSWLHRLTVNLALMRLRRKKPISVPFDESPEDDDEDNKLRYEIGGPDSRVTGLVDRVILQAAVNQLPEGYKQTFILHDVQGYEHNEIAKIRGHSTGNSKSQLHKARKRLRELLQTSRALEAKNGDVPRLETIPAQCLLHPH